MNETKLAEMLDKARKAGYDKNTLDYLTGYIEGSFLRDNAEFDSAEFRFRSGYESMRKT